MKNIVVALLILASIVPVGVNAQNNSVSVNRETLLQLISSLQKQIAILSEQLAQKKGITDLCPNISGVQAKVPEGSTYSRIYEKCLTERELDRLEREIAEEELEKTACEESEDEVAELREEYVNVDDSIESLKKRLLDDSLLVLKKVQVPSVVAWVRTYFVPTGERDKKSGLLKYNSNFQNTGYYTMPGMKTCSVKGTTCYSEKAVQNVLEVLILEEKLKEINTKIQRAENEADKDCV